MPELPPSEADLVALAERALAHAGPDAQATAWWERSVQVAAGATVAPSAVTVEIVVATPEGAGAARTVALDDAALRAAAEQARAGVVGPGTALPEPAAGRAHQGYDPLVARLDPTVLPRVDGRWQAGAARTAIVSARGVRAFEQRTFVALAVGGDTAELRLAATSLAKIDAEALRAEAAVLGVGGPAATPPGEPLPAVLGPDAVAEVLERLKPDLAAGGALAARLGTRVAASAISLSDSPRFASTLPRSFDAAGTPRQPTPLIQDGVAHRLVTAASGHAVEAGRPGARPDHLVLVGGGAASVDELLAPIERGVYLPTLASGFLIRDGRRAEPIAPTAVAIDPLAVLAGTQALTSRQRTIPVGGSARTVGATVCPALRTSGGVLVG